jgi:hypothetical protein
LRRTIALRSINLLPGAFKSAKTFFAILETIFLTLDRSFLVEHSEYVVLHSLHPPRAVSAKFVLKDIEKVL